MVKTNQFIDDDNLTELSSLTHLLDRNEDDDTEDIPVLKHSPFYSELQFTDLISSHAGFSILDMNICNAFAKFDELEIFIQRVNSTNPVSIICPMSVGLMIKVQFQFCIFQITICFIKLVNVQVTHTVVL